MGVCCNKAIMDQVAALTAHSGSWEAKVRHQHI